MKIDRLSCIRRDAGDLIVLAEEQHGDLVVAGQHHDLPAAIKTIAKCRSPFVALVRIIDVPVTEIQRELPL